MVERVLRARWPETDFENQMQMTVKRARRSRSTMPYKFVILAKGSGEGAVAS